ncbi:uncharacterized protein PV09_03727 [Verruconis gallopava]|uniref:DUF7730 domain-containing protein n=1 Tax=Verruconis gallopava TaxID=253628 RepID=A0A0D2ADW1_9PEZI|nr:uncharacterized protein PV09_03727 [Verruconis gallopava]KIW05178.1 hypothetical protein PV09_03727 [Verruconis gallopava]
MRERVRRLLACLCLAACCPCCFPCYICAIRSRKRRRQQEEYEAIMEYQRVGPRSPDTVRPLRRSHRRRISIPHCARRTNNEVDKSLDVENEKAIERTGEKDAICGPGHASLNTIDKHVLQQAKASSDDQITHSQSQSLLYRKLPPEIRSLIWRHCVGNFNIYLGIISDEKRIRHCKIFEGKGLMRLSMDQAEQDKLMKEHYFISLLQSCRRVYTEAIPHLYTNNSFLLSSPKTLLALSSTTLLHRFNLIATLLMKYTPQLQHGLSFGLSQHDVRMWERTADLLASMKGLKNLDIILWDRSLYGTPGDWDNLEGLLKLLRKIKQPKHFTVTIDQSNEVEGLRENLGDIPFVLRYGRRDDDERFFW